MRISIHKKSFVILLLVISIFSLNIMISKVFADSDTGYKIEDYKINATVMKNGNVHVVEYLKYYFDYDMNGVYRSILYKYSFNNQPSGMEPTSSRYQADNIENIQVYTSNTSFEFMPESTKENENSINNGMNGVYSVQDRVEDGYRKVIKVYSPVIGGNYKYIKYEYDIIGAVVKYNDSAELYWNFMGKNWDCSISRFDVNVTFEGEHDIANDVVAYTHSYGKVSDPKINSYYVSFYSDNVDTSKAIDARIVFPSTYVDYSTNKVNENYSYDSLYKIENQMKEDKKSYIQSNDILFYTVLLGIILEIIFIVKVVKNYYKKMPRNKDIEYYTSPLDNLDLGEYNYLMNRSYGYANSNLLIATILDLSHKKYLILDCQKKVKKSIFTLSDSEYDYDIKINVEKKLSDLNEYEINIVNYLFNDKIGNIVDIYEFKNREIELNKTFKNLSKSYTGLTGYTRKMGEFNKNSDKKLFTRFSGNLYKLLIGIYLLMVGIIIINYSFISPLDITERVGMATGFVIVNTVMFLIINSIIVYSSSIVVNEQYLNEYKYLRGLKKYLNDYSLIKDKYPIEIALWDRYLVFATIFGIAPKVAKEFKDELLKNGYDEDHIFMTYPMLNVAFNSATINSYAAPSTGSSSTGGYSGGGSGGGGRRWWRRRRFLTLDKVY